jgi:hypothetical protein
MRRHLPLLAGLAAFIVALVLAGLLVGAAPRVAGVLLLVGVIGSVAVETVLWRRPGPWRALRRFGVDSTFRAGVRDLLLLGVAVATLDADLGISVAPLVVASLAVVWSLRVVTILLQRRSADVRRLPISWRNLEVPGVRRTEPLGRGAFSDAATWPSSGSLGLAIGLALTLVTHRRDWLVWGAVVSVAMAGAVFLVALVDAIRAQRDTPREPAVEALAAALTEYAPEVVLYYSRPEAIGYIANVWMPILEQLPHRIAVVVREAHNARLVETERLPVVQVSAATDLERIIPPSVQLALYPSNVAKNNHLIRLTGIFDVFIGHGDSDKGGSATALTRIFDEAWVSGPAARDRYRVADVGVRDEQIREVGRPQLAEIEQHAHPVGETHAGSDGTSSWEYTVLYAPTREGFFSSWEYSSILSQGATILRELLGTPGVRVLFKPHPGTGTDDPAYRLEVERLLAMVQAAGGPHEVVSGAEGLYSAFNRADLLVSDVSSVITDFLASGKPYVVTNSTSLTAEQFRAEFPSASGAYILGGDGSGLAELLADARTRDSLEDVRARTAAYLLGDTTRPPLEVFTEAIDTVLAIQRADTQRRAEAGNGPASPVGS